jgi:hypothetical protein
MHRAEVRNGYVYVIDSDTGEDGRSAATLEAES